MKVFITKYALSIGIEEKDAERKPEYDRPNCKVIWVNRCLYYGKDWHETIESAKIRAEEMRQKKILSLEKQLELLKKRKF